jgi:PKD repeat protein
MCKPTRLHSLFGCMITLLLLFSCSQNKNEPSDHQRLTNGRPEIAVKTTDDSAKTHTPRNQNFPPQWEKSPRNECVAGKEFFDTLVASDPEGSPVAFTLAHAPQGLSIDRKSGVLRFFAKTPGTFNIEAEASDTSNFTTKITYDLTVTAPTQKSSLRKPSIIINVPYAVAPGEQFNIDASHSSPKRDSLKNLSFRFDVNGDGKWDYPLNGSFGKTPYATHAYKSEGVYTVRVQVKNSRGAIGEAKSTVMVRALPTAKIIVNPQKLYANKECVLDASKSTVSKGSPMFFRWDFNNDGTWDYPAGGIYTLDKSVKKTWTSPGRYSVVLEIKDIYGISAFTYSDIDVLPAMPLLSSPHKDTARGVIATINTTNDKKGKLETVAIAKKNKPPIAHAGKPVLSRKGGKVKLRGTGDDADGRIVLYEWDFNGDGTYDWSSPVNGMVNHVFNDYSLAVLRVTDNDGAIAADTLRVVICPDGMLGVSEGPLCIDTYEWPNIAGKEPEREMTFFEAQKKCADTGKHLCSGKEWEDACEGGKKRPYPKSGSPAIQTCNVAGNRYFKNKVAPSGAFPDCQSPVGAFDMNGNVAEWTQSGGSDSAFVYGGSWHHDLEYTTCSSKVLMAKNKGYFFVGFRCCK